jgi:uncharacterized phage-associated protein
VQQSSLGYKALDIAKWFINATDRESGDAITHLKVQKLLYYTQGWAMAFFEKPLFEEDFQAWAHGPVAPSVWSHFRDAGYSALPEQKITRRFPRNITELLEAVNDKYGIYTAKRLERMTHSETPWKNARHDLPPEARCTNIILKDDMLEHFQVLKL